MLKDEPATRDPGYGEPLLTLKRQASDVARHDLEPEAGRVDREGAWPAHAFRALSAAGLMGLHVPAPLGGHGQGLLALALVTEELGAACASSAMCYGMHCVASQVIAVKATPAQRERYLRPIAEGRHVTSLALSEPTTGAHFYLPRTTFSRQEDDIVLDGSKSFVTSGGHADSYVMSAVAAGEEMDPGTFSCFVVDADAPGLRWSEPWNGMGMRGNSSRGATLDRVRLPADRLLGQEGDEIWYVFDVIAPYFLVAMSGVYMGVARAALDEAMAHLRRRVHGHTGQALSESPVLAHEVAEHWIALTRARQMLHHAARLADAAAAEARAALLASKVEVAEVAERVTNGAMTLTGGRAYEANGRLAQLLRDARAAHVMAPTTHMLKGWLGRSLLGQPLL